MLQNKKQIKHLINEGLSVISLMQGINVETLAGNNTSKLIEIVSDLSLLLRNDFPQLSDTLETAGKRLIHYSKINAFFFGDARTTLKILKGIYCRPPKVFISHKSEDKEFADALVGLLRLYIGSEADNIFCSSIPSHKIGIGKEVYPEIKYQFDNYDIFMIIVHSPRYYNSAVCLNEMGASWIMDTECCSFLTADCEYNDMIGVIDRQLISIKVNSKEAKDRMNEFLNKVLEFFELPKPDISSFSQWETDRDKFLKSVCI